MQFKKNHLKYIVAWAGCFAVRLIPFRAPNVEPVMAATMPFAKQYGKFFGFFFAAASIVLFDVVTSGLGLWTLITASAYGVVGVAASWYLQSKAATPANFIKFSIPATLFYDAVTGLTSPLYTNQTFMAALAGQVPFTLYHLIGNIAFAWLLSPVIYRYIVMNPALGTAPAAATLGLRDVASRT